MILRMSPGSTFSKGGRPQSVVRDAVAANRFVGVFYVLLAGLALVFPTLLAPMALQAFVDQFCRRAVAVGRWLWWPRCSCRCC